MPTFDFRCKACEATFEFSRPFGSKDQPKCPACKSKRTEKLLSPPAIHFKGGGFYKTDSSVKNIPKKKSERAKETPKPESKPEPPAHRSPPSADEGGKTEAKSGTDTSTTQKNPKKV